MTDLRKLAEGERCLVRSPLCNNDPATTVLAHYRLVGISGIGMKSPDLLGAWACSACHDLVDGRLRFPPLTREQCHLLHLEGVVRTQAELIHRGIVRWDV